MDTRVDSPLPRRAALPKPNVAALLFSVLPGFGHLIIRRSRRGLLIFVWFTVGVNLLVVAQMLPDVRELDERLGYGLAGTALLFSVVDAWRLAVFMRRGPRRRAVEALHDSGLLKLAAGDLPGARADLEAALHFDSASPATRLYLTLVERRAGRPAVALEHARVPLRVCPGSSFDPDLIAQARAAKAELRPRR